MKKKVDPEGLEKRAIDVKKINEKSTVCISRCVWTKSLKFNYPSFAKFP